MSNEGLTVTLPPGGFQRREAVEAIRASGLPGVLGSMSRGPFGTSSRAMAALESLVDAVDLGLGAAAKLRGLILREEASPGSFVVPELKPHQARFVAAYQLVITADAVARRLAELAARPEVEGAMELDGFDELLDMGDAPERLMARVLRLAARYLELHSPPVDASRPLGEPTPQEAATHAATTLMAFMVLVRRASMHLARTGSLRPLYDALAARPCRVAGHVYRGMELAEEAQSAAGLLPVTPDDIVGNEEYLRAGLRLARDVACYDLQQGRNPKRINPVLFGLGQPGCGKTVTAHAIGRYFLSYCAERGVPARFQVIRRTDWASSYQNASAANLVRIFREEVYGFEGVCGVYWADIDTAIASRSSAGLRMEEKQNLGAVFGIFDGTLLPKDGKWFLVCDANTMNMDEAATSRIAQNPFTVEGPTEVGHHVRLMRDLMLADLAAFLPDGQDAWERLGQAAVSLGLSGRAVEAVAGNVRARIQDFEYPMRYFRADSAERQAIIKELSHPVGEEEILQLMRDWSSFHREAEERAKREQFESEVESLVRQLNASRAAARRAVEPAPSSTSPREDPGAPPTVPARPRPGDP